MENCTTFGLPTSQVTEQFLGQKVKVNGAEMQELFLAHIFAKRYQYVKLKPGWSPFDAAHFDQYHAAAEMNVYPLTWPGDSIPAVA